MATQYVFKTHSELNAALQKLANQVARDVADEIKIILLGFIESDLYGRPSSKVYDRTGDFLDSISIVQENTLSGERFVIYSDPAKLPSIPSTSSDKLPSRMLSDGETTYEGVEISTWMAEWLELGNSPGIIAGKPNAVHMFANTVEQLNSQFHSLVVVAFNKYGVKVTAGTASFMDFNSDLPF